ncbi:MAG: tetratricopeptide repeat protein [Acidobacteriota bacterium]|nr:tetratricopeptide repeat protein [Acidobacteriota bacterium]
MARWSVHVKVHLTLIFALASALHAANPKSAGSKICSECHAKISRTYSLTPMAASSGPAGTALRSPKFDKASFTDRHSAFDYTAGRDALGYYFDVRGRGPGTEPAARRRLPYFVGSGVLASAFLISVDGFLFESPVTWYSHTGAWDLSPGYENYSYPFLTRAIVPRCLECHASGVRAIAGTQNGYATPPFLEGGVGCERCHGPGDSHVAQMKAGRRGRSAIVNPAALDAERRDSICAQCHLTGDVIVERAGKEHQPFIPGEKLQDHSIAFVRSSEKSRTTVTSHVENLAQSKCKRVSGDRLWCGTCHDPHSVPPPSRKAAWFRAKCMTCHAAADCTAPRAVRQSKQDDCTSCHMPRNPVADAQHVVYTDHSIPRLPAKRSNVKPSPDAPLTPFGQKTADARDLGLAYAIMAVRERNAKYGERAFDLLKQTITKTPNDPQVLSYLADLYKKHSDDRNALSLYERLRRVDPSESSAPVALGGYAMERGDYEEAIRYWSDALRKSPALLLVRANLAVALLRTGRAGEARAVLEKALEFHPGFKAARDLLEKIRP